MDRATLHLRHAALYLQLGQPARCLAELQPLLGGDLAASTAVRFNATLLHERCLAASATLGASALRRAQQQALAQATELGAMTARIDHAARVALLRGRLADDTERVVQLGAALELTRRHSLGGMASAAHAWLAQALAEGGQHKQAQAHIEAALSLRDQGYVTDQMPGVEIDAIAVALLGALDPARAQTLRANAVRWIRDTAAAEVPEPFRHGFLHVHPVHRQLLAAAPPTPPAAQARRAKTRP